MGNTQKLGVAGAWLITMAMVAPAWGEPGSLLALASVRSLVDVPVRVAPQRPTLEVLVPNHFEALTAESPVPAPADPNLPQLRTSLYDKEPKDLRLIVTDGDRPRLMEFKAAVTWHPLTAKLSAFGQLPYVLTNLPDGNGTFDGSEPASLGIKGEAEGFEAGVQYRSVGKRLERLVGGPPSLKDREGYELWAAQRMGLFKLRISDSELTDNVDRNPALPRITRDQNAVTAGLAVPEWPVLEMTYAAGDSTRLRLTPQGRDGERERYDFDSLTGSAYYYGGPWWEVAASSTIAQSRHAVRTHDETTTTSQDLSLTLRLLDSLTAVPVVSFTQEHYVQSAVRSDTGTAGLTLFYVPPTRGWSVSTYGGYTSTRTSDSSIDGRNVSLTGALTYALGQWLPKRSTVSVECGYDRYVDGVVPQSSSSAISGFVLLRIAGF